MSNCKLETNQARHIRLKAVSEWSSQDLLYCVIFVGTAGSEEGYRPRLCNEDLTEGRHVGEGTGGARSSRARCPGRGWSPVGCQDVL